MFEENYKKKFWNNLIKMFDEKYKEVVQNS